VLLARYVWDRNLRERITEQLQELPVVRESRRPAEV
jgi:hypothetical protein